MMNRFYSLMAALLCSFAAFAQTPQEILDKMNAVMTAHEKEGLVMTADIKIPILGTMSTKSYSLGDKVRMDTEMMGVTLLTWTDGETVWTYDSKNNKITIEKDNGKATDDAGDAELLEGIGEGYDLKITKETADSWFIQCKKNKSNTDKDAPKTMDVVVAKGTYYPVSLKAKMKGITMVMRDFSFGVSEKFVTFDINDYPGAAIEDKRNEETK